MRTALPYIVGTFEGLLALAGALLLWQHVLRPSARLRPASTALPPWIAPLTDFLVFLLFVLGGSFVAAMAASVGLRLTPNSAKRCPCFVETH